MKKQLLLELAVVATGLAPGAVAQESFDPVRQCLVGAAPRAWPETSPPTWPVVSGSLYGVDISTDLLQVFAPPSPVSTGLGFVATPIAAGLDWDPRRGLIYAVDSSNGDLVTIDPGNGDTTMVGSTALPLTHGCAINPATGVLYVASDISTDTLLYTVNKQTAVPTLVGSIGFPHIGALDFDPTTGILYGAYAHSTIQGYLVTIDTSTGAGQFVADTHRINGLSFDDDGRLLATENGLSAGVNTGLFVVNKVTGAWMLLGTTSADNILGLTFRTPLGGGRSEVTLEGVRTHRLSVLRDH